MRPFAVFSSTFGIHDLYLFFGVQAVGNCFVANNSSVSHGYHSFAVPGNVGFVSDHYNGATIVVQALEYLHDFLALETCEVSGRFVGKDESGLGSDCPGDGYTLLLGTSAGLVVSPALGVKLSYDPLKDFACVGQAVWQAVHDPQALAWGVSGGKASVV